MKGLSRPLIVLSRMALVVAGIDLATKGVAAAVWGTEAMQILPALSINVVQNVTGAFGWSVGAYTWQLNLALTLCAVIFIVPVTRDLAEIDPSSPRALGLIVGGALGNLMSLLAPPPGVTDFIALHWRPGHQVVLNVADVAAYAGLGMLVRTTFRIVVALREQARLKHRVRIGSAYAQKAAARGAPARVRPRLAEVMVKDWSRVVDLGVVRADATPVREGPHPRPLGVSGEHDAVRLVESRPLERQEPGESPRLL